MAERFRLTGYLAAASTVTWTSGQSLDSAVNGEWTDLSDEIDNTSNLYPFVDLEIVLGSAAFTGAGSRLEIYIVPSVDGTNYPNWTGNVTTAEPENAQYWVASVATSQATAAQRMTVRDIRLPPGKYKYGFRDSTGATLAASGNTVKWRPHSGESTTV